MDPLPRCPRPRRSTRAALAVLVALGLTTASVTLVAPPAPALAADGKSEPTKKATELPLQAATPTPTQAATLTPTDAVTSAATPPPAASSTPPAAPTTAGDTGPPGPKAKGAASPAPAVSPATATPAATSRSSAATATATGTPTPTGTDTAGPPLGGPDAATPTPLPPLRPVEDTIAELPAVSDAATTTDAAPALILTPTSAPTPTATPTATPRPTRPALLGRNRDGLSLHVLQYLPLILGAAEEVGVDPAVLAAFMETEGSGEDAVSPAGAMGLMQLMPDKLAETDDPFDAGTNILRAAQLVRRLSVRWNGDLAAMAGAYFGAVDGDGRITDDTDGYATGLEYVSTFAAAYERWAVALDQPLRPVAIRPAIRQRRGPPPPNLDELADSDILTGPERDRWYLDLLSPQPVVPPIFF